MTTFTINEIVNTPARFEALPQYITEKDEAGKMHVYVYDHSALTNGYVRKNALCKPVAYKGNFGVGYTINFYNARSTRYALKAYYVEISHKVVCYATDNCTLCPLYGKLPEEECWY